VRRGRAKRGLSAALTLRRPAWDHLPAARRCEVLEELAVLDERRSEGDARAFAWAIERQRLETAPELEQVQPSEPGLAPGPEPAPTPEPVSGTTDAEQQQQQQLDAAVERLVARLRADWKELEAAGKHGRGHECQGQRLASEAALVAGLRTETELHAFVVGWRRRFVAALAPRCLAAGWDAERGLRDRDFERRQLHVLQAEQLAALARRPEAPGSAGPVGAIG
jgi:hypothetical protein